MAHCKTCGHVVAGSAWKCERCGDHFATGSMTLARIIIAAILVGLFIALVS